MKLNEKPTVIPINRDYSGQSGGEENRTPVQTYSSKAFYMLIPCLYCRKITGIGQPTISLAVSPIWIRTYFAGTAFCNRSLYCF